MAIQKQINYQVNFQANINSVQTALQSLQGLLNNLTNRPIAINNERIVQATNDARQLQKALETATNVNTGKLDITKFQQQLTISGKTLTQYGQSLAQLGPQGQQAFLQLARSVSQANVQIQRTNGFINSLWINLKNVAKWQISSNILMGFTSSIGKAVDYTKDLNTNLNDIRIVSEQSAEQMDLFAKNANKAAKDLSTTTNKYTKAALIYYQQGLDDQQVKERTDTTIKMANVTGEAADDVSSYMTAIWNNFDNGSKSLEYYADVMTALGAATASSTDEIATGLEKFAGIAETVGLSYEYATSALATLVAETRQSPETVGTALKTIFSRLQGLKLGETLDDGTNLNKYSEALATVGVNIKNSNGTLKDMDLILEELASKWNLIGKDQQMALAQTVGGVRQYTQLITLMDNWGDMQNNLNTAFNSEGELTKQAKIYEESWEASSNRVQASLESLYSSLVPEDFLISFNNMISEGLEGITMFSDAIGGAQGLISLLGTVFLNVFQDKIANGINMALSNFKIFSGVTQSELKQMQQEAHETAMAMTEGMSESTETENLRQNLEKVNMLQQEFNNKVKQLSPSQKQVVQQAMDLANQYGDIAIQAGRAADEAREMSQAFQEEQAMTRSNQVTTLQKSYNTALGAHQGPTLANRAQTVISQAEDLGITAGIEEARMALRLYQEALNATEPDVRNLAAGQEMLREALRGLGPGISATEANFTSFQDKIYANAQTVNQSVKEFNNLKQSILNGQAPTKEMSSNLESMVQVLGNTKNMSQNTANQISLLSRLIQSSNPKVATQAYEKLQNIFKKITLNTNDLREAIKNLSATENVGGTITDKLVQDILELVLAEDRAASAMDNFDKKIRATSISINNAGLKYKTLGETITATFSVMTSISMAMASLSTLKDTLNNDDLTTWEKFSQVMMSLGTGLPALGMAFNQLKGITQALTSTTKEGTLAQLGRLMGLTDEQMAVKETVTLRSGEIVSLNKLKKGQLEGLIGKKLETGSYRAGQPTKAKEILLNNGIATTARISAKETLLAAGKVLLAAAPYIALAAAVGGLVYAMVKLATAESQEEQALKRAQAGLEEATTAYDEVRKAADEFKNTIGEYDKGIAALENLKKGTDEYAQALEEANQKARDLIETYDLFGKYKFENGVIVINEDAINDIQNQKEAQANAAENVKNAAQIGVAQAEVDLERRKVLNQFGYIHTNNGDKQLSNVSQGYYNANTNEIQPNQTGSLAYSFGEQLTPEELDIILKAIQRELETNGIIKDAQSLQNQLTNTGLEQLAEEIFKAKDSLIALNKITEDSGKQIKFYSSEIIGNVVKEEYSDEIDTAFKDNEEYKDQVSQAVTAILARQDLENSKGLLNSLKVSEAAINSEERSNSETEDYLNTLLNKKGRNKTAILKSLGLTEKDIDSISEGDKKMALVYAKMLRPDLDETQISIEDGTGVSSATDLEGNLIFAKDLKDTTIRNRMLQIVAEAAIRQDYIKEGKNNAGEAIQALSSLTESTKAIGEEFGIDFTGAVLDGITNGEIDFTSLFESMGPVARETFQTALIDENGDQKDTKELLKFLGIKEEDLTKVGISSAKDFFNGWNEASKNHKVNDWFDTKKQSLQGKARARLIQYEKEYYEAMAKSEKEAAKAAEDRYNQWVKEQEIIDDIKTKLTTLRENKEVQSAYDQIMENPQSTSAATEEAYAIAAGYIGSEFGVDLSAEKLRDRWNNIKPLLDAEALEWGQIQSILYDIQRPESFEEFKGSLQEVITQTKMTEDDVKNLYNIIYNFDPSAQGFNKLITSLNDANVPAQVLVQTLENLKGAVPENLVTTYTVLTKVVQAEEEGSLHLDQWFTGGKGTLKSTFLYKDEETVNKLASGGMKIFSNKEEFTKWVANTSYANAPQEAFLSNNIAFIGSEGGKATIEFASTSAQSNAIDILRKQMAEEDNNNQPTVTIVTDDSLKNKENWDASSENDLERDSEYLAKWRGMLEDNKQDVAKYQSIVDSSITSDQEKLSAVEDLNRAYKDQSDYLNNLAWGYDELAKKSRNDIFTEEGKLNAETIVGYDKNNNPITLGSALAPEDFDYLMNGIDWANINEGDKNIVDLRIKQLLDANDKDTKAALVGITDEAAIESIQNKGKNRTTGLNYFLTAFTDYFNFDEQAKEYLRGQQELEEQINKNKLDNIELTYAQEIRDIEAQKAQFERSLAYTENSNDLDILALRIERQGDLARLAFREYEISKQKYEDAIKEGVSDKDLHDIYINMVNAETEAINSQKTVYEELTNVIDKYYEQMDHLTEGSDTIISVTESMKEILDNLNKESQKAIANTNRTLITLKNKNLEILKQERDTDQAIVKELKDKLAAAEATGNQVGINMYRQQLDEATSKWRKSEEELMSELASTLDQIGEIYEETIDNILKEWSEVAAGLQINLESLSDEFKKQKDIQEQYLDDETQIYELDKMRRTINKELASNKNLIAQRKLSDVLEKINEIQEKGIKMSEYDLKMLQTRYDLRKAEIALEEAQNNKSEVRLMRNAQGNWSYVFTANQSAIADAEQKVADEQEKIRNETEEYSMQVQEKLIEMEKERQEALAEAYKEYKDDEKALQKETDRINAYYNSKFQYFGSELGKTLDVLGIEFSDTSYSILTGYKSWDEAQTQFAENGVKYLDQMSGALGQFKTDSKDAMEAAGHDIDTFATNVKDVYAPQIETAMNTVVDSVGNKCKEMLGQVEQMIKDMIALMDSVNTWKRPKGSGSSYKTFIDKDGDVYTGIDDNGDGDADLFFSAAARGYDTGGYTGDWNSSDGKIAILHEKELVLNKADTENILSAVDIMRSIVGSSYGQIRGLANAFSVNNIATPTTQLEQQVHIEATFPGVTNALEIETALNNIVNDVAQYTQKK